MDGTKLKFMGTGGCLFLSDVEREKIIFDLTATLKSGLTRKCMVLDEAKYELVEIEIDEQTTLQIYGKPSILPYVYGMPAFLRRR